MYKLPDELKREFAKPWAPVLTGEEAIRKAHGRFLITVGDVVTETFRKAGLEPAVAVVDGKTQRQDMPGLTPRSRAEEEKLLQFPVVNTAGTITEELWRAIISAVSTDRPSIIVVDGEEDLAALPAVLLGPEGAMVAYGQPPVTSLGVSEGGVVIVEITPETRDHVKQLLSKMEVV